MAKEKKMDVSKMSDEDIESLFYDVFEEKVASFNNITSFECKCVRDSKLSADNKSVGIEVMIAGLAGSPTPEDFKAKKVVEAKCITISRDGESTLAFVLKPEKTYTLNTNDYIVVYEAD